MRPALSENNGMFRGRHYLLLLAVSYPLFLLNLGGASLWDVDEGRNAEAAFEMLESGNWVVPTFNAQLRVDKPALLYWLQVAAYRVWGVNEYAARLPSALAALLTVIIAYELGRALFGPATGLLSGLVAASTPMLCGAARFANPDALLNLCTVATLTLFWVGRLQPRWWWFAALGSVAGLGVLAKGPVGCVLPAAVVGGYLLLQRDWRLLGDRRWVVGVAAMLAVALPWYIWVAIDTRGNFLQGFLVRHNIERFTSPMENHRGTPLFYPLVLLVGTAPWSVFAAPALWFAGWSALREPGSGWRRPWTAARDEPVCQEAYRFLWCWILTYLAFFTLAATKLPNYVLPVVVPCAVLLARYLERWRRGAIGVPAWVTGCSLGCLLLVGCGLGLGLACAGGAGQLGLMRGRYYPELTTWAALGLLPVAGAAAAAVCWLRQRRTGLVACLGVTAVLLLAPLAAYGSALFNDYKAPQPLVAVAQALRRQEEIRIGGYKVQHLPSLNFYVRRDVLHLHDDADTLAFLAYPVRVFLFVPAEDWARLSGAMGTTSRELGRQRDIYSQRDIVVVTNR
jgi:4-amino-4-deoxy-L-arabinose transferase-like glycosyltransferase